MVQILFFINLAFTLYKLMILVVVIASWKPDLYQYASVRWVASYTEPYLAFFRKIIPPFGMIDISPIIAYICLNLLESLITSLIVGIF